MSSLKLRILKTLGRFVTERAEVYSKLAEAVRKQLFFEQLQLRDDDIYIITFMKSGTTWMQMICYQLLTDGNMDFSHIYDVSPWLSNAAITGVDAETINKLSRPRVFKCHDPYENFNPDTKSRFIYVYRDGEDVAISLLHHIRNYGNPNIAIEDVYQDYFSLENSYNWFGFTESWLSNKYGFNVLFINYADLKSDFDNSVKRLAKFLDVELTENILDRVRERSSFAFMKNHETKFGEQPSENHRVYDQFIREGKLGSGKELSQELHHLFVKTYEQHIKPYEEKLN